MKEFLKGIGVTGYIYRERYNALTKTGNVSLDSIIVAIGMQRLVIKFSVGGDWDLFGGQSREIETRNYEKDKHIQALIVELYVHVSNVNYDGYPVMIDRISMLKYQRLQYTIAHEYWRRRMMEAASVMERVLAKKNV